MAESKTTIIQQQVDCPGCPEGCGDIGDLNPCDTPLETISFCCTLVIPGGFTIPAPPEERAAYIEDNFDIAAYFLEDEGCFSCRTIDCVLQDTFGEIAVKQVLIEGCIKFIGGFCVASDSALDTGSQAPVCCEGIICVPDEVPVCIGGTDTSCDNLRVIRADNITATFNAPTTCDEIGGGDAVWEITGDLVFACGPCPVTTTTTTTTTTSTTSTTTTTTDTTTTTTTTTSTTTSTTTTTAEPEQVCFCQVTTAPGATIDDCDIIIGDGCPCDCSLMVEVCTGCMVNGSQITYIEGDNSLLYQQVGGSPFNVGELCSVTCPTDDTAVIEGIGEWNGELCNFRITLTEVPGEDDEGTITIFCPVVSCSEDFDDDDIVYRAEFEFAGNSVNINPQPCEAQE